MDCGISSASGSPVTMMMAPDGNLKTGGAFGISLGIGWAQAQKSAERSQTREQCKTCREVRSIMHP